MNILFVTPNESYLEESVVWRCQTPASAINRLGRHRASLLPHTDFIKQTKNACSLCEKSDAIIIHRNLFGDTLKAIEHWKTKGKILVGDMDCAYPFLDESHPEYAFWYHRHNNGKGSSSGEEPLPIVELKWGVQLVDFLMLSSRRLVDDWKSYATSYYVPYFIEYERYIHLEKPEHPGLVIGWRGSRFDLDSLEKSGAMDALREIIQLRPQVKLLVCSMDDIAGHLQISKANLIFKHCSLQNWPQILSSVDIGIAPLHGELDQRRGSSNILEYLVMKIPWVGSAGGAFHDLGSYGWLVKNQGAIWRRILLDMIDHYPDYRSEAKREPYLYGLSQGMDENIHTYIQLIADNHLLNQRRITLINHQGNLSVRG